MTMNTNPVQRPSIGFLSANIHVGASRVLWPGVLDAAETADVNLICSPNGVEYPRANVTLATQLSPADCQQLALG
jgi:hypothetical protein